MITYPPDIVLTAYEGNIRADELMSRIRRQLHWAQQEEEELKADIDELEDIRREEWIKKEILLEATMSGELAHAYKNGLLSDIGSNEKLMVDDVDPIKRLKWTRDPYWKDGDEWAFPNAEPVTKREMSVDEEEYERTARKSNTEIKQAWEDFGGANERLSRQVVGANGGRQEQRDREDEEQRLSSRGQVESAEDAQKQQAEDDTMAVEALMGLSAAAGGSR